MKNEKIYKIGKKHGLNKKDIDNTLSRKNMSEYYKNVTLYGKISIKNND